MLRPNAPKAALFCALPDAIPQNAWLVVPCDSEYTPLRDAAGDWRVVASFPDRDTAERHASIMTDSLKYISLTPNAHPTKERKLPHAHPQRPHLARNRFRG